MKRVIKNESRIRLTANGQSIVEGSFAKVNAIEGKTVIDEKGNPCHSSIKGIYSQNRNFVPKEQSILNSSTGLINLSQDFIDLLNSNNVDTICVKQKYILKSFKSYKNIKLTLRLSNSEGVNKSYYYEPSPKVGEVVERQVVATVDKTKQFVAEGQSIVWFNDYSDFKYIDGEIPYISYDNQIEFSNKPTRFTEQRTSQLDFPSSIVLRSTLDGTVRDIYFPELGKVVRNVSNSFPPTPLATPTVETYAKVAFCGYQVFNNGYEKILTDNETALKNGAIPTIHTTYLQEERQGMDNTRFDFFMIDGESFSGIGYEQLKTTNQLTYVSSPSRQNDGSMNNIEDYESFVIGAGDIGFSLINPETYVRLKEKLCSKRTFEVSYYDKDFDRFITKEMYVKPIDLDNFLSLGDRIIGMKGFTLSFVPTLNEETEYTATFYTSDNQQYGEQLKEKFGRAIETLELPIGYNYWLIKKSGFNSGNFHTIKGKKKLNLFGDTELVAIK